MAMLIAPLKPSPTDALDLRPLLELRAESDYLAARLRVGDLTCIERARALLAAENGIIDSVLDAVVEHGHQGGLERYELEDGVAALVAALGTGFLGCAVDEALSRAARMIEEVPDGAVAVDGFEGWVELVDAAAAPGRALVRFPGGSTVLIAETLLRPYERPDGAEEMGPVGPR